MKLFARILLLVIASFLLGHVVVNACGDEDEVVLNEAEEQVDSTPDFPMVSSLIKF